MCLKMVFTNTPITCGLAWLKVGITSLSLSVCVCVCVFSHLVLLCFVCSFLFCEYCRIWVGWPSLSLCTWVCSDFYFSRWELFLSYGILCLEFDMTFDEKVFTSAVMKLEQSWAEDQKYYPNTATGDTIEIANRLFQKYFNYWVQQLASCVCVCVCVRFVFINAEEEEEERGKKEVGWSNKRRRIKEWSRVSRSL